MRLSLSENIGALRRAAGMTQERLAEALGYAYYDRELLTMLAERTDLDEAYLAHTLEESAPSALFPITIGQTFSVLPNYQAEYSTQLLQKQTALIKELATKSDCVIVGRCADYILREKKPLRLFVYADPESKLRRCREKAPAGENLTDRELRQKIRDIDKNRARYYEFLTGKTWSDKLNYDLCINTTDQVIKDLASVIARLF